MLTLLVVAEQRSLSLLCHRGSYHTGCAELFIGYKAPELLFQVTELRKDLGMRDAKPNETLISASIEPGGT